MGTPGRCHHVPGVLVSKLDDALWRAEAGEVKWQRSPIPLEGAVAYAGTAEDMRLLVVSFSIEDQGFPPDSLGYDGTITSGTTIVHIPRDIAETLHKAASEAERKAAVK